MSYKVKDIRFSLNGKNEKDKKIIDFLDSQYDTNGFIKQVLYRLASNNSAVSSQNVVQNTKKEEISVTDVEPTDYSQNIDDIKANEQNEQVDVNLANFM